jgi:DNA helicase-2/ATP-dependent DNA helicase PcrA
VSEICFELSDELGETLDGQTPGAEQALTLSQPLTPISQRYAEREGVVLEGQCAPTTEPDQRPVWQYPQVVHAIFGAGRVVGEDERSFEVSFANGDTLNFSKKSAHLYFTVPTDLPTQ